MKFKNKIIPNFNGQQYYISSGKPTDNHNIGIYVLNVMGQEDPDFSLWYIETLDDEEFGEIRMWPYDGADSDELLKELMEDFLKTAFTKD